MMDDEYKDIGIPRPGIPTIANNTKAKRKAGDRFPPDASERAWSSEL